MKPAGASGLGPSHSLSQLLAVNYPPSIELPSDEGGNCTQGYARDSLGSVTGQFGGSKLTPLP